MKKEINLLAKIIFQDLDKKIAELPQILQIREKIFYRFLPNNNLWQKRLALDIIFCEATSEICKEHTLNTINSATIGEDEIKQKLYIAGLPQDYNTEILEAVVQECRNFIGLYIDDIMKNVDVSNSQILYHRSYFLPADISKNVLIKYLNSIK